MHLDVAAVALGPVPQLAELGRKLGPVHDAGLGGDAVERAGVDGGPAPGPGLAIRGAERSAGDDAVVVELGVGGAGLLLARLWREAWWGKRAMTRPWARSWRAGAPDAAADQGAWRSGRPRVFRLHLVRDEVLAV